MSDQPPVKIQRTYVPARPAQVLCRTEARSLQVGPWTLVTLGAAVGELRLNGAPLHAQISWSIEGLTATWEEPADGD